MLINWQKAIEDGKWELENIELTNIYERFTTLERELIRVYKIIEALAKYQRIPGEIEI